MTASDDHFPVQISGDAALAIPAGIERFAGLICEADEEFHAVLMEVAGIIWEAAKEPGETVTVHLTMDQIRRTQPAIRIVAIEASMDDRVDASLFKEADRALEDTACGRSPAYGRMRS
jgi:hypothetical protein